MFVFHSGRENGCRTKRHRTKCHRTKLINYEDLFVFLCFSCFLLRYFFSCVIVLDSYHHLPSVLHRYCVSSCCSCVNRFISLACFVCNSCIHIIASLAYISHLFLHIVFFFLACIWYCFSCVFPSSFCEYYRILHI